MGYLITNILEPFSYLIMTIALLYYLKYKSASKIWVLFAYCFFSTILMSTACIEAFLQKQNIDKYDKHLLTTAFCIGVYYYSILISKKTKFFVIIFITSAIIYFVTTNFVIKREVIFDSIGYSILSLSIVFMTIIYFNHLLNNVSEKSISINIDFWINTAFLIYYLGSFIIFFTYYFLTKKLLIKYTSEGEKSLTNLWGYHNMLLFSCAVCILIGVIWQTSRTK